MHSLRRRLIVALAVGMTVLVGGASVFLSRLLEAVAVEEFDAALVARARGFIALTEQEGENIELDYAPEHAPEFSRAERPDHFQFWLDDGRSLLRSPRLSADLPRFGGLVTEPRIADLTLPDGRAGRRTELAYVPQRKSDSDEPGAKPPPARQRTVVVTVARGRERLDAQLATIRWTTFGAAGALALLAVVLVWRAVAAGFRPVDAIAAQVRTLDAGNLTSRISLPRMPKELAPIVLQLNSLLDRLAASFQRERRFSGNVAHELRTPIAELRSLASVATRWPDDAAAIERFFEDVDDIARRMESVIADLLLLARCQAGVEAVSTSPINLREVLSAAWSRLLPAASARGLDLVLAVPDDLVVESDPGKLSIVVGNLLGNAVAYAKAGGEVRCVGTRTDSGFSLSIENAAEPLTATELERIVEPFWRKDESRTATDHAGLGLSLVSALAALLGLLVAFENDAGQTFRVRLVGRTGARLAPASHARPVSRS